MASYNRVILLGNVTRDIELRYTTGGMAVTDLGLAVNDRRKNQAGEWIEETTFVDVTLWGRTAEVAGEYLSKGSPVLVEGRLRLDTWEQDGQKRSRLRVVGERMQMLGTRAAGSGSGASSSSGAGNSGGSTGGGGRPARSDDEYSMSDHDTGGGPPHDEDDIPF
jgi:single-strand DNA-binding protein